MLFSQLFFNNSNFNKDHSESDTLNLIEKSCIYHKDSAGIYSALTLGLILEKKLTQIIEEKMMDIGFSQVRLSLLQDMNLWEKSQRINSYGQELFTLKNRKGHRFCLGATAEEIITQIYHDYYHKKKSDLSVFQIGQKYRDEIRVRSALVRAKEFIMKDGYSFHSNIEQSQAHYQLVRQAYQEIFSYFDLSVDIQASDTGEIGGKFSEEFLIHSDFEEDKKLEIAHIFNLGDTYSKYFNLLNEKNEFVQMNCYGIGISRLLMALLQKQQDELGFYGTEHFNTFDYIVSALDYEKNEIVRQRANHLYQILKEKGYRVLLDDRIGLQAGKKLVDSELIGVNKRIIISKQAIEKNYFELTIRKNMQKNYASDYINFI